MKIPSPVRRIGIMGGSFDPVHFGHLIIAQDAVEQLNLSELIFVPAAIPPHKQHLQKVDARHRLRMLQLAVNQNPFFSVSNQEIQRGGISYSVETIKELRIKEHDAELIMIVGGDTLVDLHNWHKIDELLALCEVASFLRPGIDELQAIKNKVKLPAGIKERLMENIFAAHLIEISSTEIRNRVSQGRSLRYLLPEEVEHYIYEQGLYQV